MNTLEQLEAEVAAMPDPMDVTPRQLEYYERKRSVLLALIQTIRSAMATLADVNPPVDALTKWRDHLLSWRKDFCEQLLVAPPNKQLGLKLSIMRIDRGLDFNEMLPANLPLDDVMREAGYVPHDAVARANGDAWLGSLPTVERRLAELTARRDDAQARLDAALKAAF